MVKNILDTDILSEYLKGFNPTVASHAARYAEQYGILSFTSVTVYEIVYGLELKTASAQLEKALAWLDQNEQITPVNADYLAAATIRATARHSSRTSRLPDRFGSGATWPATRDRQHGRFRGDQEERSQSDD